MSFEFIPTRIPDVLQVVPRVFDDPRGYFMEVWQKEKFRCAGLDHPLVQINESGSVKGTLRGLHYQLPNPQGKLVRALTGTIFDVAVDLRRNSSTCGGWVACRLTEANRRMLWIPPGFGHGFLVESDHARIQYMTTDYYHPEDEKVMAWDDPEIGIAWPLGPEQSPLLSDRDRRGASRAEAVLYP